MYHRETISEVYMCSDPLPAPGDQRRQHVQAVVCHSKLTPFIALTQLHFHSILGSSSSMVSWLIAILINGWQWLDSCSNTRSLTCPGSSLYHFPSLLGLKELHQWSSALSTHCSHFLTRSMSCLSHHTVNNDPWVKSCTNAEPWDAPGGSLHLNNKNKYISLEYS